MQITHKINAHIATVCVLDIYKLEELRV